MSTLSYSSRIASARAYDDSEAGKPFIFGRPGQTYDLSKQHPWLFVLSNNNAQYHQAGEHSWKQTRPKGRGNAPQKRWYIHNRSLRPLRYGKHCTCDRHARILELRSLKLARPVLRPAIIATLAINVENGCLCFPHRYCKSTCPCLMTQSKYTSSVKVTLAW